MTILPLPWLVLLALWVCWMISWRLAARWASAPTVSLQKSEETRYRLLTIAGVALLFLPLFAVLRDFGALTALYPESASLTWLAVALAATGFAFMWWARVHLGTLWSATVTRKDDHRIVDTGPYALVRHPIYTGIILAALATAIAEGTLIGLLGAAIFALSFYVKAYGREVPASGAWARDIRRL